MRNLLTRLPKSSQDLVATLVRSIFMQPDAETVRAQHGRVVAQLDEHFTMASMMLDEARDEFLVFAYFSEEHRK